MASAMVMPEFAEPLAELLSKLPLPALGMTPPCARIEGKSCGRIRPRLATRSISCRMLAAAAPRGGSCSAELPDLGLPPTPVRGMFRLLFPSTIARLLCILEPPLPLPLLLAPFSPPAELALAPPLMFPWCAVCATFELFMLFCDCELYMLAAAAAPPFPTPLPPPLLLATAAAAAASCACACEGGLASWGPGEPRTAALTVALPVRARCW
mmetsp:Transcript_30933/g.71492  ORF Transcript_30933/g.71492 Transcript_30933/m.71492 type:complete len:211 (-) Transcript_30933:1237-1869(-)